MVWCSAVKCSVCVCVVCNVCVRAFARLRKMMAWCGVMWRGVVYRSECSVRTLVCVR